MERVDGVVGVVASVREVAEALVVRGALPAELDGALVWSGKFGVSGVCLGPDGAEWYRGPRPAALAPADRPAGATMARPVFDGEVWHTAMSHPDLGYAEHVTLGDDGEVLRAEPFPLDGAPRMRAVGVTDRFVVVFDSAPYYSRAADLVGLRDPYSGPATGPARVGLLAYGRPDWFELGDGEVLSLVNVYEDLGRVVVDAIWAPGVLRRHVLDLATGGVRRVDLPAMDVGTVDERFAGRHHRFVFGTAGTAIVRHDVALGCTWRREVGVTPVQPVFVPRGDAEGDGWVVAVAGDEVLVLDAADLAGPPVAVVRLPFAVAASRQAAWVPRR
ncbi:retinal pigment epithelial membrane protein [Saccharothrix carnea]|uniref:Dioxygenase n=1 Tax=Saccharothrix carnea TaxID=1280637 RepID=A0A2P8I2U0_SACCR|nr:carotenoid oxygenase family protein [Saccharothrix carnea]PSL52755.1 retinal pigment epithelial membrane protein [Saccharothrix carnea]